MREVAVRLTGARARHMRTEVGLTVDLPREQLASDLIVTGATLDVVVPEVTDPGRSAHAVKEES